MKKYFIIGVSLFMLSILCAKNESVGEVYGKVAILSEKGFSEDNQIAEKIVAELQSKKIEADLLSVPDVADRNKFNNSAYDTIIIPEAGKCFMNSIDNLIIFIKNGGNLVVLNGPAFSKPYWKEGDGYVSGDEINRRREKIKPEKLLFDFEDASKVDTEKILRETRDTNDYAFPVELEVSNEGADGSQKSLKAHFPRYTIWETFALSLSEPLPPKTAYTCLWAKGSGLTQQLAIEWTEEDTTRWIATINLSPEWKYYVIPMSDFKFFMGKKNWDKRGFPGDKCRIEKVKSFRLGLSIIHTLVPKGEHTFWADQIGVSSGIDERLKPFSPPLLDTISPEYKFYPISESERIESSPLIGEIKIDLKSPVFEKPFSPTLRPQGIGFKKDRNARFIPLLKIYDKKNLWCGTASSMLLNLKGEYKNSIFANITFPKAEAYKESAIIGLVGKIAMMLGRGLFFEEAGTEFCGYFSDQNSVKIGATILNLSNEKKSASVLFRIKSKQGDKLVFEKTLSAEIEAQSKAVIETDWNPERFEDDFYIISSQMLFNGNIIDSVSHEFSIWNSDGDKNFVTIKEGHFLYKGNNWIPVGVNYMPSSGAALEDFDQYEHWFDNNPYDPEIIDTDLERVSRVLNMNMVSAFMFYGRKYSGNLLDFSARCKKYNLKINLALRPAADPLYYEDKCPRQLISFYRLDKNDVVFAYDIAWEPCLGHYEHRKYWEPEWEKWIIERYGSLDNAEADWGYTPGRNEKNIIKSPDDDQLMSDGDWRIMVAAYRRFADDLISKKYNYAVRKIKEIDPNHLISFRMYEAGNPEITQRSYPYDVRSIAKAVDFFTPEGYARFSPVWDMTKTGIVTTNLCRSFANKPVFWGEFGMNIWGGSNFFFNKDIHNMKRIGYENFYRMIYESKGDGASAWWFTGGYRVNEQSDYGVINPDGSPRLIQSAIDKYNPLFSDLAKNKEAFKFAPEHWIIFDRDKYPDSLYGIYKDCGKEFWEYTDKGKTVGFKSAGMGTNSVDTPLVAVGNTEFNGKNPIKYLNAEFNYIKVQNDKGEHEETKNESMIYVSKNKPVYIDVSIGNIGDAAWIKPDIKNGDKENFGTVFLATDEKSDIALQIPINRNIGFFEDFQMSNIKIADRINYPTKLIFQMCAKDKAWFGEKSTLILIPR